MIYTSSYLWRTVLSLKEARFWAWRGLTDEGHRMGGEAFRRRLAGSRIASVP
jgi:hypothetical protein